MTIITVIVTQIYVVDSLCCMWKILVMERMPLSMDRGLCMPCVSTSSACFYHMYMLPLFILTDIYFQITSKCNNVRLVLSNTGSGLFCRIGTVLPLFFLYSDINVAQAPITPF